MHMDNQLTAQDSIDIEYLKNNISEDQLLLLYWYIIKYESEFSGEQLAVIYELVDQIDNRLKEINDEETQIDTVRS